MRVVISSKNPGPPNGRKYKFLLWVQYSLPKLFLFSGVVSIGLLIVGLILDAIYSSAEADYTWFQRSGAVIVGWSIFIGMLQQQTFNHSNTLKGENVPKAYEEVLASDVRELKDLSRWLWIIEAFSLLFGTLVWAFGDMITDRFLHCGQWMCASYS